MFKIESISLKNFIGWKSLFLDLKDKEGILLLLGSTQGDIYYSNGVGKSSVVKSITYAIFGKLDNVPLNNLIRQGEEEMIVELIISYNNQMYQILRSKKVASDSKLIFKNLSTNSIITEKPDAFFKLNYEVWFNTIYSAQGDLIGFIKYPPAKRKEILFKIFDLDKYYDISTNAKNILDTLTKKQTDLLGKINMLDSLLKSTDIPNFDEKIYNTSIKKLEDSLKDIESKLTEYAEKNGVYMSLKKELYDLGKSKDAMAGNLQIAYRRYLARKKEMDDLLNSKKKELLYMQNLKDKINFIKESIIKVSALISNLESEIKIKEQVMTTLNNYNFQLNEIDRNIKESKYKIKEIEELKGRCDKCLSVITEEHKQTHIQELNDKISAYIKNKESITDLIKEQQNILSKVNENESLLKTKQTELANLKEELANVSGILKREDSIKSDIEYITNQLNSSELEYNETKKSIEDQLAIIVNKISEKESEFSNLEKLLYVEDINSLKNNKNLLIQQKEQLAYSRMNYINSLKEKETYNLQKQEISKELDSITNSISIYSEIVKAFHHTGIPALILANWLTELQSYISEYVSILCDNKITIEFRIDKEKNGKYKDTLDIIVTDVLGARDISLYSGGEQTRIFLAIRFALLKILNIKMGVPKGIIIIDEISELDSAGMESFITLLNKVKDEFSQIFFVSHISDLNNLINNQIILNKNAEGIYEEI